MKGRLIPLCKYLVVAITIVTLLIVVSTALLSNNNVTKAATPAIHYGQSGSLVGATPTEIGQFAVEYAQHTAHILSGTPQVILARSITENDISKLGLGNFKFASQEKPPLTLVVLKGDFDSKNDPNLQLKVVKYTYLTYIFDDWAAEPAYIGASQTTETVNKIMQYVNSPDFQQSNNAKAAVITTANTSHYHYGDVVPPLTPTIVSK